MLKRTLLVMIVLLVLSALFAMTVAAQGTGDPANGKTLWAARNCKNCHGDNGEGKYAGPRAGDGLAADAWIKQVHTPRANMPAFSTAQISDTVITDMWAYMQTLPKPASFTPVSTTVPAGALPGHQLTVDKRCVACHGDFKATVKARFVDQNREVTTDAVLKQLRTPAKNMPMFTATQVTDPQAAQIADYLKAQAVAVKAAAVVTSTTPVTATKPATTTVPAAAAAPAAAPATMPKTGGELGLLTLSGLAMLGISAGLAIRGRRR
jgi:LPXTG-motif cell wall-anchored protein